MLQLTCGLLLLLLLQDVADAIQQMHEKGRYRELLLVVETCQAATLYSRIT
jgi:phosphatidylinositol glycan class K